LVRIPELDHRSFRSFDLPTGREPLINKKNFNTFFDSNHAPQRNKAVALISHMTFS